MAVERDFYLHVHSNSAAVRVIFGYEPDVKILWAHAGLSEPPEVAMQLMDEYRNLWVDISIREHAIAPGGELSENWQALFLKHPDRITIGSDTWIPSRWGQYEQVIEFDRGWLAQLPREVAEKIAYRNAVRLFGAGPHKHLQE
jgi:predicted TIM-barrel fold metal-dependent hydrolase